MGMPDFYQTRAWKATRRAVLQRDLYLCAICGIDVSGVGAARVDHIKPRSSHPELSLDTANLRTLCTLHDAQAHREKGAWRSNPTERDERFESRGCDARGWPLTNAHPWRGT